MSRIIPVILCGGAGTRLWPLSRTDRPKQFVSLSGDRTLLEETLLRAQAIAGATDPLCVTAEAYGAEVRESLDRLGLRGRLLLEPEPRNTAPALCAAALVAARTDPQAVIVALPADHFIEDDQAFVTSVTRAVLAAEQGWLTVLGVRPRHASSALGYIMPAEAIDGLPVVHRVGRFIEKPEPELAETLIAAGALWNAGIVVARAHEVIDALQEHEPALLAAVQRSLRMVGGEAGDVQLNAHDFGAARRISFDNAVLERQRALAVTALDSTWRDVGTWGEVAELYPVDAGRNRHTGKVHFTSSRNSFVFSPYRLTVGIGLTDVVVVDTPDALLVASRDDLAQLRDVVEAMAADSYPEVSAGSRPVNAWTRGEPEGAFQAIEISLAPEEILRRQPHHDVARHWIVLEGSVKVTIGGESSTYVGNQSFLVPPGIAHKLASGSAIAVKLIEVKVTHKNVR